MGGSWEGGVCRMKRDRGRGRERGEEEEGTKTMSKARKGTMEVKIF